MPVTNQTYAEAVARISQLESALRAANTVLSIVYRDYSHPNFTDRHHTATRIKAALDSVHDAIYPSEVL